MSRETICLENLGSNLNNGPEIVTGKAVRKVVAVIGNNPSYTALTDDEIVEFSKVNEECIVAGRAERGYYYRIAFIGKFSLDNICYAIMRPCRCVLSYMNDDLMIKTARYTALNSLSRLSTRLKENDIKEVIAYKVEFDGTETEIIRSNSADELIADLQSNRYRETFSPRREGDSQIVANSKIEELQAKILSLENQLVKMSETNQNRVSSHTIFVYGTLMRGQANHDRFLADAHFLGNGTIEGYEMYDLGYYPGIVSGKGVVYGELYSVSDEELAAIDRLEGEGSLYIKTAVGVKQADGNEITASVYVYNHSVCNCSRLSAKYGSDEYVWYVSYGSNILEERLGYYIKGGVCPYNNHSYRPCSDTTMPIEKRPVTIPYDTYYSNYGMGSWANSAVAFLDLSHKGMSYGRAYKIKKSQLPEVHAQEGNSANWYPECIRLGDIDGVEAYTFAGRDVKHKEPFSRVSAEYGIVLFMGMKECYPEMSDIEIFNYLGK